LAAVPGRSEVARKSAVPEELRGVPVAVEEEVRKSGAAFEAGSVSLASGLHVISKPS
jgi:hypothetical protein